MANAGLDYAGIKRMTTPYCHHRRVEFRDTDAAGIVHFSVFFNYMEEAEHALLRSLDFSVLTLDEQGPFSWPRVAVKCDYKAPLRFGEAFEITVRVARLGRTSVTYAFDFRRGLTEIATAEVVAVCCRLGPDRPTPVPIPEALAKKLRGMMAPGPSDV